MLNHLGQETQEIIDSKNERKWQRHQINLETKLNDAHAQINYKHSGAKNRGKYRGGRDQRVE